jgi:beta-lactamase regulating signal transducer with metallopeptidase domain/5-hydroxyisourate hydrolase-like protein (transthyretin family)
MSSWHSFVLTVLVQVTAITVVASVAMAFSRLRAALRHTIGVLALIFVFASPILVALLPRANWLSRSEPQARQDDSSLIGPVAVARTESQPIRTATAASVATPIRIKPARESSPPGRWTVFVKADRATWLARCFNFVGLFWVVGIVVLSRRFFVAQRQLWRMATSADAGSIDAKVAHDARLALGLSKLPPCAVSELAPMPFVLGCWRPLVVLPRQLVETGPTARLRDVLIHECAHILRRDPYFNAAQQVVSIVFWPHPSVHWLNRQIAQAREEVCDNFVLLYGNATDYAQTLLELAEHCGGATFPLALMGLFSRRWTLEERISGILKPGRKKTTRASRAKMFIIMMFLTAISILIGGVRTFGQVSKETATPSTANQQGDPAPLSQSTPAATIDDTESSQNATGGVTIHGICHDQDSKPIPNARVRVFRIMAYTDAPRLVADVRSDDDGKFAIMKVEAVTNYYHRNGLTDLMVVATARGYASSAKQVEEVECVGDVSLALSSNPDTLSGVVTDSRGRPLKGVSVFLPNFSENPLPDYMCAVTDEQGRYAITDLNRWQPEDSRKFDPKTRTGTIIGSCSFLLRHPDYALTRASYSAVPQKVDVTLHPPAIVDGQVVDQVTGQPLANVVVSAQGVARSDWYQTRTDHDGRYRLLMNKDHFNIWAEADDRIAIAVKTLEVESGKTIKDADIRMVRGGFVVGTVIDGNSGQPINPAGDRPLYVAHYGPARPRTGHAVTSTPVNPDGTYRLRVAPGRNYVYLMNGAAASVVNVEDGQEVKLDLSSGESTSRLFDDDPDNVLAQKLRQEALDEDARHSQTANGAPVNSPTIVANRQRRDTPTGQLLDQLERQNAGSERFQDSWCRTLKEIVDLGSDAVPELIEELDATNNDMMMRCLGFTLRAIGDQRAVPALIRAIPKTLEPPGSDMGLVAKDADLARFAQQYELESNHERQEYGLGRPVREVFGALERLTEQKFNEQELYNVFLDGTDSQKRMKRDLYYRMATMWADWWELNAANYIQDSAYSRVSLEKQSIEPAEHPPAKAHYKTGGGSSGWVLQSIFEPTPRYTFYDLGTGRTSVLPQKWRDAKNVGSQLDEILAWAGGEGFDLMGTEYVAPDGSRYYALQAVGLEAWELGENRWKMQANDITIETMQDEGRLVDNSLLLHFDKQTNSIDPKAIASFFFVTREGTPGLLFVGIEVKDDSLKPGGVTQGDGELSPIAFTKGRRFGFTEFEEIK